MSLTERVAWTLLHFLWQGALVALALAAVRTLLRRKSANTRYLASCVAMLLMLVCIAITFVSMGPAAPAPTTHIRAQAEAATPAIASEPTPAQPDHFRPYLPLLVYAWFAGVCALAARSAGGWIVVQRFRRRSASPA